MDSVKKCHNCGIRELKRGEQICKSCRDAKKTGKKVTFNLTEEVQEQAKVSKLDDKLEKLMLEAKLFDQKLEDENLILTPTASKSVFTELFNEVESPQFQPNSFAEKMFDKITDVPHDNEVIDVLEGDNVTFIRKKAKDFELENINLALQDVVKNLTNLKNKQEAIEQTIKDLPSESKDKRENYQEQIDKLKISIELIEKKTLEIKTVDSKQVFYFAIITVIISAIISWILTWKDKKNNEKSA